MSELLKLSYYVGGAGAALFSVGVVTLLSDVPLPSGILAVIGLIGIVVAPAGISYAHDTAGKSRPEVEAE